MKQLHLHACSSSLFDFPWIIYVSSQVCWPQAIFTAKHLKSQLWTSSAGENFPNRVFTFEFEKSSAVERKIILLNEPLWPLVLGLAS